MARVNPLQVNNFVIALLTQFTLLSQIVYSLQDPNFPICTYCDDANFYPTYKAVNVVTNSTSYTATLQIIDPGSQSFGENFSTLHFAAYFNTDNQLRVTINGPNNQRFQPDEYVNQQQATNKNYVFEVQEDPFSFSVKRTDSDEVIFNTSGANSRPQLYFSEYYLEIGTSLPQNPNIYGLGERVTSFRLNTDNTYYTMWTLAQDCPYDTGNNARGGNMYGHHPIYLEVRNETVHGVFFHNFNAQDAVFTNTTDGQRVGFKTVGGLIDLYIFVGPTGEQVIQQFESVIGKPNLPPYWALGFHQCRWGYYGLKALDNVVYGYDNAEIPFDVLWSDIDYMVQFQDFTLDTSRFPAKGMQELISNLHKNNRRWVPILDAGIAQVDYFGYNVGKERNVFIQRNANDTEEFIGQVWPGKSVFIDFQNPNATQYWSDMLDIFNQVADFDGIWLDMNEASSFCNGECPGFYSTPEETIELKYVPGKHSLEDQLLPLLSKHYGDNQAVDFNYHSLYAYYQVKATYEYLAKLTNERPFILSRSSRSGLGVYGNHWLGDNYSNWQQLKYSFAGVLDFQLYGIPLTGADVCGFHNTTTVELCSRWIEVGSMYPFFRNHNDVGTGSQEFFTLGDTVAYIAQKFILLRYQLHLYFYSLFFTAAQQGGTVWRPMFFEFPSLTNLYDYEFQVMIGDSLLFIPVVNEYATYVSGYLPESEIWYDIFTGKKVQQTGQVTLETPLDSTNLLLRGGKIIPSLPTNGVKNLYEARQNSVSLIVGLDSNGQASGVYYVDDGLSLDTLTSNKYTKYTVNVQPNQGKLLLTIKSDVRGYGETLRQIGEVHILGLGKKVKQVNSLKGEHEFSQVDDIAIVHINTDVFEDFSVTIEQ